MFRYLLVIVLGLSRAPASGQVSAPTSCGNENRPDFYEIEVDGARREYLLHIPEGFPSETEFALIINFHGFGDCASDYADSVGELYGLNDLADEQGFVVAYPQAMVRAKGDPYWEPGGSGGDIELNDLSFTRQLVADVSTRTIINPDRVFAAGYSNGGMMAYDLACRASDLFPAVAIMSGVMLADSCDEIGATSIIHFHGLADTVIPLDGSGDFPSVLENIAFWIDHNGIPNESLVSSVLDSGAVTRDLYAGGRENTSLALYVVNREFGKAGGHVWFSDAIDGSNPNQIMWRFLSASSVETPPSTAPLRLGLQWFLLRAGRTVEDGSEQQ